MRVLELVDMSGPQPYDVVIVGGGVAGTALLYGLARYTDLSHIALVEKYPDIAAVNSKGTHNSQTIHCGDIETNYSLDKALSVQRRARMVIHYATQLPPKERDQIIFRYPKMVLGVGDQECQFLQDRYHVFQPHYPGMRLLDKHQIAEIEPQVAQPDGHDRPEALTALAITEDYSAINYAALARSFVKQAMAQPNRSVDLHLSAPVQSIRQGSEIFEICTPATTLRARFVAVSAGGHSLLFAHRLGYGLNYSCLPMAGSFYFTPKVLNGKVYTIQNDKLPFAAIHGDPDVLVPHKTRFGPTALPLPMLERYTPSSIPEYFQVLRPDPAVVQVLWDLFKISDIRNYLFKNILFDLPLINHPLFLRDVRKIVPALQLKDLEFAQGYGGIRPQLIDKQSRELKLGQAKIDPGTGILFNVTPSPGATNCLGTAEEDLHTISRYLGCRFDHQALEAELVESKKPVDQSP